MPSILDSYLGLSILHKNFLGLGRLSINEETFAMYSVGLIFRVRDPTSKFLGV